MCEFSTRHYSKMETGGVGVENPKNFADVLYVWASWARLHSSQKAPRVPAGQAHLNGATHVPPCWQPGWQNAEDMKDWRQVSLIWVSAFLPLPKRVCETRRKRMSERRIYYSHGRETDAVLLQGDPSGWLKTPVDLILAVMAAVGPLLKLPTARE